MSPAQYDEILSIASHDMRNRLNALLANIELLAADPPPDDAFRRRLLDTMKRAADRMNLTLTVMRDAVLLGSERLRLDRARCPPAALVAEAVRSVTSLAARKGVRLESGDGAAPALISVDRERLVASLSSLLCTAIELPPHVEAVRTGAAAAGGRVEFSVVASGAAVAPEMLEHLLDRDWWFARGSQAGLGLGLWVARGVAEAHEGTLVARDVAGNGLSLTLALPA